MEIVKHVTGEITWKIYIRKLLGKFTSVKHVTVEKSLQMGSGNDGAEVRIRMGGGEDGGACVLPRLPLVSLTMPRQLQSYLQSLHPTVFLNCISSTVFHQLYFSNEFPSNFLLTFISPRYFPQVYFIAPSLSYLPQNVQVYRHKTPSRLSPNFKKFSDGCFLAVQNSSIGDLVTDSW